MIIVKGKSVNENSSEIVYKELQELGEDIPMIILGESSVEASDRIVKLDTGLEIQPLIKQCAQFLGVTAKDMANLSVGSFFPIGIDFFKGINESNVNVYSKNGDDHELIFNKEQKFGPTDISSLITTGHAELFVKSGERLKFVSDVTAELVSQIPLAEVNDDDFVKVQEISMY